MDTLLVLKDTITAHVAKVAECCQPCIQESETMCSDVKIVSAICITIVLVVSIVSFTFYRWQKNKKRGLAEEDKQKLKNEITEDFKKELKKYSLIWKPKDETLEELTKRENKELRFKAIDELSNICKAGIQKNASGNMDVYSNIVNKIYDIYQDGIGVEKDERESTEGNTSN